MKRYGRQRNDWIARYSELRRRWDDMHEVYRKRQRGPQKKRARRWGRQEARAQLMEVAR